MTPNPTHVIAGTGHRSSKLGGYGIQETNRVVDFARTVLVTYQEIHPNLTIISGMAQGWDQALAEAAVSLDIPFIAAVPFIGYERQWPERAQRHYKLLCSKAKETFIVCPGGYSPAKLQIRNHWMVNHANEMLALWNGTSGGTFNCAQFASTKNVKLTNVWDWWLEWTK